MSGISITNNVLNVNADPAYPKLEEGLLRLIVKHPTTREDVTALLAELEEYSSPEPNNGARFPMIELEVAADAP